MDEFAAFESSAAFGARSPMLRPMEDNDLATWARRAVRAMLAQCLLALAQQFTDAAARL